MNQSVEVERARERRMWALFEFLTKRPDLAANEDKGGDGERAEVNKYYHKGLGEAIWGK